MVRAKVAASAFARGYLNGIVKNVFQQLQDTGYFYDPVEREVRGLTVMDSLISYGGQAALSVKSFQVHGHTRSGPC